MSRLASVALGLALSSAGFAQFVWPKPEYHVSEPGLYTEDPFIVEYRKKFFSVFRGDFATFDAAFKEVQAMVKKNPKDARAVVWFGNGQTVKAGLLIGRGQSEQAKKLLDASRKNLDYAVSLRPDDPNIYMMRAATLYIQGQYFPNVPRSVWERLRDDCLKFIRYVGPDRMPKASIHLRGETYGELGIAYKNLGELEKARDAFRQVIRLCPDTLYSERAQRELELVERAIKRRG